MNVVGKHHLDEFKRKHSDAITWIDNWVADVEGSNWRSPQDIKDKYASASFLGDGIVIFVVHPI